MGLDHSIPLLPELFVLSFQKSLDQGVRKLQCVIDLDT
jgi:hypothetical protein